MYRGQICNLESVFTGKRIFAGCKLGDCTTSSGLQSDVQSHTPYGPRCIGFRFPHLLGKIQWPCYTYCILCRNIAHEIYASWGQIKKWPHQQKMTQYQSKTNTIVAKIIISPRFLYNTEWLYTQTRRTKKPSVQPVPCFFLLGIGNQPGVHKIKLVTCFTLRDTWMSQQLSKWLVNGL